MNPSSVHTVGKGHPEAAHESSSSWAAEGYPDPFSLNNDRYYAPPEEIADIIKYIHLPEGELDRQNGHEAFFPVASPPDQKRSLLNELITRNGFKKFVFSFWQLQHILRSAIAEYAGITNTDFQPFRGYNFLNCFKKYNSGQILTFENESGAQEQLVQKMYCGNKYCSLCTTKKRSGIAAEYTALAKEAHLKYGMKKVWSFVFTLPANLEGSLFDESKKIRKEINALLKKTFNVRSRDNLGVIISTHPVGDDDIFRDRLHFHAIVFPLWINKSDQVGTIDREKIDLPKLKAGWAKILPAGSEPINPQVKYIELSSGSGFKNLGHMIKYTVRSFAQTVENSVVKHSSDCSALAIKADHDNVTDWRIVPVAQFAERYIWIIDQNTIQPYGWLRNIKKWRKNKIFADVPVPAGRIPVRVDECIIEYKRFKQYSKQLKKIVWVRKDYCYLLGVKYEIGKDIQYF